MKHKKIFLVILFIILLGSFILISCNIHTKFKLFKEHKDYFNLPSSERQIEPWMTLRMIDEEFGVNVPVVLNEKRNFLDDKMPLENYANKNDLNISQVILDLENARKTNNKEINSPNKK